MGSLEAYRKLYPSDFYARFLSEQIRPDGREVLGTRSVNISTGSISTAYGSSMVKLGSTAVVAGVQGELAFQDPTIPSQLIINIEVGGISGTNFSGKPSQATQALSSQLTSLVQSCNLVRNLEDLYVESEDGDTRVLWYLYVDLYCLDHDGNLFDACLVALVSALKNVRLPQGEIIQGKVIGGTERPLRLDITPDYPLSLSFSTFQELVAFIGNFSDNISFLLADPTHEEEELAESFLTVVASADNSGKLWQIYKPGGSPIPTEKLKEALQITAQQVHKLASLIHSDGSQ